MFVVNPNYGLGYVNCKEKSNGLVRGKPERDDSSKSIELGELENRKRTSGFCKFVGFVIVTKTVYYLSILLSVFNRNSLHHFLATLNP